MKNRTLAIDEEVYVLAREYTKRHRVSLGALVRKSLKKAVGQPSEDWLDNVLDKMDKDDLASKGKTGTREAL